MTATAPGVSYAEEVTWQPARPRFHLARILLAWLTAAAALLFAAWVVPGVAIDGFGAALLVALVVAVLNAVLPPLIAALRLPFTVVAGFLLVLLVDALMLMLAADLLDSGVRVDSFGWALLAALVASAASVALEVVFGADDEDAYTVRVIQRIARRSGERMETDVPGILFLEIDGLALPVLRRAMRDGHAPTMARWVAERRHKLVEWEPDLSSQTGASQAGILLGSNEDIPAFRWVDKKARTVTACSAPGDCAEIEQRLSSGRGLLRDGGASRGNLLSGEADHVILTVSRIEAERGANPGYRAFFANGFNVTRALVLFAWEVLLEWTAAARSARRDVRPRGHRGGIYPLMRAAMCVVVRDLIVYGVLSDLMRGRPAIYATFSSYDEVAHHSGLERADTLEALRKLDQQFGRIERACRYAPRPYEIVVLSDHGQTQGATFKQRNGYSLEDLVQRCLGAAAVHGDAGGDEQNAMVGLAVDEATGQRRRGTPSKKSLEDKDAVVLGSGNLGLIYLLDEPRRLSLEEIDERHPELLPTLRAHPHIGWLLVLSERAGPVVLGPSGVLYLDGGRVEGVDPLASFPPNARSHLLRTSGFGHVADIMVGSFYDPVLDEGCAFEELISFHGGLGGPQAEPFVLYPVALPDPAEPLVGAARINELLAGWREGLQGSLAPPPSNRPHTLAGDGQRSRRGTEPETVVPSPGDETIER